MPSFVMTDAWQRVAAAGGAIDLQLVSNVPVRIVESDTLPDPDADGEVLTANDGHRSFAPPSAVPTFLWPPGQA